MLLRTTAPEHPDLPDFDPSGLLAEADTSALTHGDLFFPGDGTVHFFEYFGKVTIRDQRGVIWMSHWGDPRDDTALTENALSLAEKRALQFLLDNGLKVT